MNTLFWGQGFACGQFDEDDFLKKEKKEKGIPDDWGFNLPFELFSRLGLFLSLGLQRVSSVVVVGVQFQRSGDRNGSLLGSVFLFGSSTQTQSFLLLIFFISCLVGEKVVEKSRNRRKDDRQPKICWFSLCLVNFLYFLFSLCFSRQPNKSCVILISCFTWFWKKFFDVVFFIDECVAFSVDACVTFSDDRRQ